MADTALRDAIGAAMDKSEGKEPEVDVEAPPIVEPEDLTPREAKPEPKVEVKPDTKAVEAKTAADKARDERGRFAPKAGEAKPEAPKATPKGAPAVEAAPVEVTKPTEPALKAPQSWTPMAREKWTSIPPEIQQDIIRREKDQAKAMARVSEVEKTASEATQHAQAWRNVVAPYEGMIRAEGGEPLRTVAGLLQTAVALRTAPPSHKAQLVASIISTYGVPTEQVIAHLATQGRWGQAQFEQFDQALAGALKGGVAQNAPVAQPAQHQQPYRDPRVDQLLQKLETVEKTRNEGQLARAQKDVETFASEHEFFDDVRGDMADLMEVAAKRDVVLSFEDAYHRSIALNPEISKVLEQRDAAKAVATTSVATQRTRAAASSVRSHSPAAGPSGSSQPESLRAQLEAAWDGSSSR